MAKLAIKSETSKSNSLFPIYLSDLIPQTHIVRVVDRVVDELSLSKIYETYNGGGNSAFSPQTMLKVWVYAYLCNIYSSRKVEQALKENINFMWLSGMTRPDYRTLNWFRGKRLKPHFDEIFTQIVVLLSEQGFVSLKVQYVDGTKLESCANKYTFVWRGSVEKNDAKLKVRVAALLAKIEKDNNLSSDEMPSPEDIYNSQGDYYVCPMGQHMEKVRDETRISDGGYRSLVSVYRAKNCEGCPLRSMCHKSKSNRQIEVNHQLNFYRREARELLTSAEGLVRRSRRPIEPEAVFGQLKANGMFRRMRLRGMAGVSLEFGLKAMAHNIKKMAQKVS